MYKLGDVYAIDLDFCVEDRCTRIAVIPGRTSTVELLNWRAALNAENRTIDMAFVSTTGTDGGDEVPWLEGIVEQLGLDALVPMHFEKYFDLLPWVDQPVHVGVDIPYMHVGFDAYDFNHNLLRIAEDTGAVVQKPALFSPLLAPLPDTVTSRFKLQNVETSRACLFASTSPVLGDCDDSGPNTWIHDPTGKTIRYAGKYSPDWFLEYSAQTNGVALVRELTSATEWSLSATGRLSASIDGVRKCLTTNASVVPFFDTCKDAFDKTQRWSRLDYGYIQTKHLDVCVTGQDPLELGPCEEKFTFEPATGFIRAFDSGLCMRTGSENPQSGDSIKLGICDLNAPKPRTWVLYASPTSSGANSIRPRSDTSLCVSRADGSYELGTPLTLAPCGTTQEWLLKSSPAIATGWVKARAYVSSWLGQVTGVANAKIEFSGSDCGQMLTDSAGYATCRSVPTGTQTITIVPPKGFVAESTKKMVTVKSYLQSGQSSTSMVNVSFKLKAVVGTQP
jgi:hypothetical protein